jgi:hypothetical protein
MFGNDRTQMRRVFTEAWRKQQAGEPLEPLEQVIVHIERQHPEYHRILEQPEQSLRQEFPPEAGNANPFLHLAMHLGLQEQIATDRPAGISALYQQLIRQTGDSHTADHRFMECLGTVLWEAQQTSAPPDESAYLECLQRLLRQRQGR